MIAINIPAVSYAIGAVDFLVMPLLPLTAWRGRLQGGLPVSASAVTVPWRGVSGMFVFDFAL